MAVKKSRTEAAPKSTPASTPKSSPKKATAAKPAAPKAEADTAAKAGTPKAAPKAAAPKAAKPAAAKAAPIKLTDNQTKFLREIQAAGEPGYHTEKKALAKTLDALLGKKLIKKGAKNKATGAYHFTVSKAGEKHLSENAAS